MKINKGLLLMLGVLAALLGNVAAVTTISYKATINSPLEQGQIDAIQSTISDVSYLTAGSVQTVP